MLNVGYALIYWRILNNAIFVNIISVNNVLWSHYLCRIIVQTVIIKNLYTQVYNAIFFKFWISSKYRVETKLINVRRCFCTKIWRLMNNHVINAYYARLNVYNAMKYMSNLKFTNAVDKIFTKLITQKDLDFLRECFINSLNNSSINWHHYLQKVRK